MTRPPGNYRIRRNANGTPILDIELARRGIPLYQFAERLAAADPPVSERTLQRLRYGAEDARGTLTTAWTAYAIARALDPDDPDAAVARLFEVVEQKNEAPEDAEAIVAA